MSVRRAGRGAVGTPSVFMSWIHRDLTPWLRGAGGRDRRTAPCTEPGADRTAAARCAGPRARIPAAHCAPPLPRAARSRGPSGRRRGPPGLPHGRFPAARRPLTALCRPRCPCRAGGVRPGLNEAQPEEDAAPGGEEGAPGRRLPGRGGRRARLQGLVPGTGGAGSRGGEGRAGVGGGRLLFASPPWPEVSSRAFPGRERGERGGASADGCCGCARCTRGSLGMWGAEGRAPEAPAPCLLCPVCLFACASHLF